MPTIGSSGVIGGSGSAVTLGGGGLSLPAVTRPVSTIRDDDLDPQALIASIVTDSGLSESSESAITLTTDVLQQLQQSYPPSTTTLVYSASLTNAQQMLPYGGIGGTGGSGGGGSGNMGLGIIGSNNCGTTASSSTVGGVLGSTTGTASLMEMGHSRNSSNTSQMSKGSGYSSFSHSQHSRQSSEGDSGHASYSKYSVFSKSVSLLNRLNQKQINSMKLNIPCSSCSRLPTNQANEYDAINEYDDSDEVTFQTPNSTLRDEEFRTPLNEMPNPPQLSSHTLYDMQYLNAPSPTYRSIASNSRSHSHASQLNESGSDESETADDSGLDENYHTPRVAKIKSMENLSILEMEFHKASQELDRNSPRRLKLLAEHAQIPKMKSLNNLCFDNYSAQQVREEFMRIREQSLDDKLRFNSIQQRKSSTASTNSGKLFVKNKVGNAKFIGIEESPLPQLPTQQAPHYPIQKIRSMGTIPDVVTERIETGPFLTPTSERKHQQYLLMTQSAEKATPPTIYATHLLSYDAIDAISVPPHNNAQQQPAAYLQHSYSSLTELYSYDGLSKLLSDPETVSTTGSFMSRTPFERAYRRSAMKSSSTPLRQPYGYIQQYETDDEPMQTESIILQQQFPLAPQESLIVCPHSNNAAYELMRNPSSGSLVISETGSLDRMKSAAEKRKKGPLDDGPRVSDRVEETRVNPNSLIDEILKDTKLDQLEESAETSGLQLYIARDGTASLGSHEVKSRVLAGAFKQVVMENPR